MFQKASDELFCGRSLLDARPSLIRSASGKKKQPEHAVDPNLSELTRTFDVGLHAMRHQRPSLHRHGKDRDSFGLVLGQRCQNCFRVSICAETCDRVRSGAHDGGVHRKIQVFTAKMQLCLKDETCTFLWRARKKKSSEVAHFCFFGANVLL